MGLVSGDSVLQSGTFYLPGKDERRSKVTGWWEGGKGLWRIGLIG